jgi:hypothetical protein
MRLNPGLFARSVVCKVLKSLYEDDADEQQPHAE